MGWGTMATGAFVGAANRGYQDQRDRDLGYQRAQRGLEWEQQDRDFAMEQRPMQRELQQMQFEDAKAESHRKALERDWDKVVQTYFLKGHDPQVFGDMMTHYFPNGVDYNVSLVDSENGKKLIRFQGSDGSVVDYADEDSMFQDMMKAKIPGYMRKAMEMNLKSNAEYRNKMLDHRLDLDKERYKTGLSVQAEDLKKTPFQKEVEFITRDIPGLASDEQAAVGTGIKSGELGKDRRSEMDAIAKIYQNADELYPDEPQKAEAAAQRGIDFVNKKRGSLGGMRTPPGRGDSITITASSGKSVNLPEGAQFSEAGKNYKVIRDPQTKNLEKAQVVQEAGKTYAVVQGRGGVKKFELKSNAPTASNSATASPAQAAQSTPPASPAQGSRNFDANGNLNLPAPVAQQPQQFRPWLQGASSASPIMAEDFGVDMPGAYNRPQPGPVAVAPAGNGQYVPPVVLPSDYDLPGRAQGGPVQAGLPYMTGEEGTEEFIPSNAYPNPYGAQGGRSAPVVPYYPDGGLQDPLDAVVSNAVRMPVPNPNDDYDYAGYTAKYGPPDQSGGQHLTDEFKRPNHITFSNESIYNSPGAEGGRWKQEGGKWHFYASPFNLQQHGQAEMVDYFNRREPDAVLHLPGENPAGKMSRPIPAAPSLYGTGRMMGGDAVRGKVDMSGLNEPIPDFPKTYGQSPTPNYPVSGKVDTSALNEPIEQPAPIRGQSPIRKVTYPGGHTGRGTDDPNAISFSNLPIDVRSLAIQQIMKGERTFTPKFDAFVKQAVTDSGGNMARAAKLIGDKMDANEIPMLNVPEQAVMDMTGGINKSGNGVQRPGSSGNANAPTSGPHPAVLPFMQAMRRFSPEAFDGQYSAMGGDTADVGGGASIPMRRKTITDAQKAEANMQNAEAAANKAEATIKNNPVKGQGSQQAQKTSAKGPGAQPTSAQKSKPSRRERQRRREAERRKLAEGQSPAAAAEAGAEVIPAQTGLPDEVMADRGQGAALSPYGRETTRRPYDPVQLVIGDRAGEATNRGPIRPIPMSERDYTTRN
jgi:hypothetical protein